MTRRASKFTIRFPPDTAEAEFLSAEYGRRYSKSLDISSRLGYSHCSQHTPLHLAHIRPSRLALNCKLQASYDDTSANFCVLGAWCSEDTQTPEYIYKAASSSPTSQDHSALCKRRR
ncbi:hypothetical protein TgHK011_000476 [Trichoderma gracile]|nr:hypothetical protein TgHK011_000476 [Trichoderma gracile]